VWLHSFSILGTWWGLVVNVTARPLYSRERNPVPIMEEAGWVAGRVWKVLPSTGFMPGLSSPKHVAIPTTLSWSVVYEVYYCKIPNTLYGILKTQHVPVGRNWNLIDGIATRLRVGRSGLRMPLGERFCCFPKRPDRLWFHPSF
jgi:hypothetical protein